jgi:hypothetical protein
MVTGAARAVIRPEDGITIDAGRLVSPSMGGRLGRGFMGALDLV